MNTTAQLINGVDAAEACDSRFHDSTRGHGIGDVTRDP
jgi:hypothetical protein